MVGRGIQKRVPAEAGQVPLLRHAVEEFSAASCELGELQFAVSLCVSEACANVVRHAYPNGGGMLSLTAQVRDEHLVVEISDDGVGLNGASTDRGLGVGMEIMYCLADTRIRSDERGTVVELRFACPPRGAR